MINFSMGLSERLGLLNFQLFLCKSEKELLNAEIRDVNSLQIIDTVLLKTYLQSSPSMISSLLRLKENFCLYNECEKLLSKNNKIPELVLLMKKANKAGFHSPNWISRDSLTQFPVHRSLLIKHHFENQF